MISKKTKPDYWFTIEPYVHVKITSRCALLYNILDGTSIELDDVEVINLLKKMLQKENCGVVLLTADMCERKSVSHFVEELREKYMGDIIDVSLSNGKPVQLLPFFNFFDTHEIYKQQNFSPFKNALENLFEISIHVDTATNIENLIIFLQSLSWSPTFNIVGNIQDVKDYKKLLSFLDQQASPKYILCSYTNVVSLQPLFTNNFLYNLSVNFPIDIRQWNYSRQLLLNQNLPIEYIFDVSSLEDCKQVEQLVEQFQIEKYHLNPIYTQENISFFEENVFLTKDDILSTPMSIKDFFSNQSVNIYDFGKITIMPNGDVYANINHPLLGNMHTHSIYEIVHKEVEEGQSWFRIRNQVPCNNCIYQWICPSPSNYEIAIGRPNLCHVNQ